MSVCEKCWAEARIVWLESGVSQMDAYKKILSNQRDVHELEDENAILRDALKEIDCNCSFTKVEDGKHQSFCNLLVAQKALKETE